jgi:hypothetical protein
MNVHDATPKTTKIIPKISPFFLVYEKKTMFKK